MTEPTVEFDMDEVERRLGAAPSRDAIRELERAAVERGARAFASLVLFSTTPVYREHWRRAAQMRVMIAVYLLRMPGHEALCSLSHIGRLCGVSGASARQMAIEVRKKLGLPPGITRTHRWNRRQAL
jgi:hypothetical protein